MRKRHRNITINNEVYSYSVKADYEYNNVNIFKDRKLVLNYTEAAHIDITPAYIKEKIEQELLR